MLKVLRSLKKNGGDSSSDSEEGPLMSRASNNALRGVHDLRRKIKKKPRAIIDKFALRVQRDLGVRSSRQVWSYPEWCRTLQSTFGKLRGLYKVQYGLCEILESMEAGRTSEAEASVVQMIKCLLQVALEQGDWANGQLLLPWDDPTGRPEWGGEEEELEHIFKYRKA
eukprot:6140374-Karenia_brevis.AAC.1